MKQYIILLISILVGSISVLAQEPTIRPNEDAATYFSKASIMDSTVFLVCNEKFVAADRTTQTKIVGYVMTNMAHASRAVIKSNDKCWFWYLYNN